MMLHRPREKLGMLIVFLLPLVLVKGGSLLTGGGPGEAAAFHFLAPPPPEDIKQPEAPDWSAEQLVAAQHVAYLRSQPFGPSPLLHVAPPPVEPVKPDIPKPDTRVEVPPPGVNVKAILTLGDGNHIALIGRKRYRVGDLLENDWYITEIDGAARSVHIEHRPTARTATLTVPLPR